MKVKTDFDEINCYKKLPTNVSKVYLNKNENTKAKVKIYPSVIEYASKLFSDDIVLFFENGGAIENLSAENVYKKTDKKQNTRLF